MATRLWGVVFSAVDAATQARSWAEALGGSRQVDEDGDAIVTGTDPDLPRLLFEPASDAQPSAKNRVHLDLASPTNDAQAGTVARLLAAVATRVDVGQHDVPLVVLADPEGTELCARAAPET